MATATYVRTTDAGMEPDRKAVSVVDVDGTEVQVAWWPSLLTQTDPLFAMSKTDVQRYLEAEALYQAQNGPDARAKLTPLATGSDTRTYDAEGNVTGGVDGRNWAQRWIDEHPDADPVTPVVDPLL